MDNIILWIGGGSLAASLIIGFLKQIIKDLVPSRFGDLGVLVVLFAVSVVISLFHWSWQLMPQEVLSTATFILTGAISIYQVLFKAIYKEALLGKTE